MPRPKGSKNKPKDLAPKVVKDDIPSSPKSKQQKLVAPNGVVFLDNEQGKIAKECNFKVSYDAETKVLRTDMSGQESLKAFSLAEGKIVWDGGSFKDTKDEQRFRGGTTKEIHDAIDGKFNIKPFLAQREKLSKTVKSLEFLEAELARKRTRVLSEYDGELDFDRLYEREPFYNTRITNNGIARVMQINVDFSFSAGVDKDAILEYGTMAWAIVDILEKAGIRCEVNINNKTSNCSYEKDGFKKPIDISEFNYRIKSSEEYIDTTDIARHFTTNYYRRVMFVSWCVAHEGLGREMNGGLGTPKHFARESSATKGVLNLGISQMRDFKLDSETLIKYIREAL